MRHDEFFDLPLPCPFLCPYDWKTHWKEERNHCDFVLLTPPLTEPEPRFDSPQPLVRQPVGHIWEKTHHLKSKSELDSAQEKHLQQKVRIQNTTSLQTSPSRQVQELTGPAHHTTPPDGFNRIERPSHLQLSASSEMLCAICSAYHSVSASAK